MIILLNGLSGSGKSSIAKKLVELYPDKYNIILSYTTRLQRDKDDTDHTFISKSNLIKKMLNQFFIARTEIDNNIYCAFLSQFDDSKINIYIVDDQGIIDVLNNKEKLNQNVYVMRILGQHESVGIDRRQRFNHIIPDTCKHIDFIFENNTQKTIENLATEINEVIDDLC